MALSDFINYSSGSDLLAKRLAQQIGQANQEQALRQNQMQAALQQQLAPLRQQEQALQVQALQQQLDPVLQEQAFQRKMQQAVALQNATQLAKLNAVGEFSPGTLVGTPEEVRAGKGFLVPGKPAATQFVGTGTGEGGSLVGTIYDPNTQTFINKPLPAGFQTKGAKSAAQKQISDALISTSAEEIPNFNIEDYRNEQGEIDPLKLAVAKGRAKRQNAQEESRLKSSELKGTAKTDHDKFTSALFDLQDLQNELTEIAVSGKEPSLFDRAIAASTATPSTGFFGSLFQQALKSGESEVSKSLGSKKSRMSATLLNAISGANVTESDKAITATMRPLADDPLSEIIRKSGEFESFARNRLKALEGTPALPRSGISPPVGSAPVLSPNTGRFKVTPRTQ